MHESAIRAGVGFGWAVVARSRGDRIPEDAGGHEIDLVGPRT